MRVVPNEDHKSCEPRNKVIAIEKDTGLGCHYRFGNHRVAVYDAAELVDRLITAGGVDGVDQKLRTRYTKADGIMPKAPAGTRISKSPDPQVEAIHAVVALMSAMVGGPQTRTAQAVRELWAVPFHSITEVKPKVRPLQPVGCFGQRLLMFMNMASDPKYRPTFESMFWSINVAHGMPYASVTYGTAYNVAWREQFSPPGPPPQTKSRAPVSTMALTGTPIFLELGEIVMGSRLEAKKRGIIIPWMDLVKTLNGDQATSKEKAAVHPARSTTAPIRDCNAAPSSSMADPSLEPEGSQARLGCSPGDTHYHHGNRPDGTTTPPLSI